MNAIHRFAAGAVAAAALFGGAAQVQADSHEVVSCLVDIERTEIGFIVTIGGGHGTLNCQGNKHDFRVGGLQIGGMGLGGSKATGEVFNLKQISDFAGTYTGGQASITTIKGVGKLDITNEKGVRMVLTMDTAGGKVSLGAQGLRVHFE